MLFVAGLGGGGRGGLGDTAAQLLSLPLLALLAWLGLSSRIEWQAPNWVRWLPALALALPLLQMLPVPEALWALGPARSQLAQQMHSVGVAPAHALSLDPTGTEAVLLGLLPAVALFLAALAIDRRSLRWVVGAIVLLAVFNVLLGMAQLGQGRASPLRLYFPTNADQAVGLFANRNHLACLLAMCLPLAICGTAWLIAERSIGRRWSPLWIFGGVSTVVLLIIGITMTGSRGGLLLGMVAVLGSWPVAMSLRRQRGAGRVLIAALAIAIVLAIQFSMVGVLQRLGGDQLEDGRWQYARVTSEAAKAYLPWGSGLGTFRQAYQPFEAKAEPTRVIVNHAHNDYLELWLEGGLPALVLLATGAAIWLSLGWRIFRSRGGDADAIPLELYAARAAWLAASIGLAHSALDYPMRTTANLSVFAILLAVAFRDWRAEAADPASRRPRALDGDRALQGGQPRA